MKIIFFPFFFYFHRIATQNPALTFLNSILYHFADEQLDASKICLEHNHEELKPQLISTWMPNGVGAMPGKRVIFAETQVSFTNSHLNTGECVYVCERARAN